MSDPAVAVQEALIAFLSTLATAVGVQVFGQAPLGRKPYPYALVWRARATPIDEDCYDRTETILQIEISADTETYIKVKDVAGQYRIALHEQTIPVAGHVIDRMRVEDITYSLSAPSYGATLSLSIETQPAV